VTWIISGSRLTGLERDGLTGLVDEVKACGEERRACLNAISRDSCKAGDEERERDAAELSDGVWIGAISAFRRVERRRPSLNSSK
jgi:hypothetical protein